MTAVDVDVLDELAFVLHGQGYCGEVCVCVDDARALLPVVDRIANKRAAAELRAMARDIRYTTVLGHIAERLDVRADELDAS